MSPGLRSPAERGFLRALDGRCGQGAVTGITIELRIRVRVAIGAVGGPRSAWGRSRVHAEVGGKEKELETTKTFGRTTVSNVSIPFPVMGASFVARSVPFPFLGIGGLASPPVIGPFIARSVWFSRGRRSRSTRLVWRNARSFVALRGSAFVAHRTSNREERWPSPRLACPDANMFVALRRGAIVALRTANRVTRSCPPWRTACQLSVSTAALVVPFGSGGVGKQQPASLLLSLLSEEASATVPISTREG